jgi:hypothetical protein
MNKEYGKDNYFIISQEDRDITKAAAGTRLIIGYTGEIKDAFDERVTIEAIFYQPTVKEIKEFTQDQLAIQKQPENIGAAFSVMNKWFNKMLLFPSPSSEAGVGLSNFLEYYPMVAGGFLRSLFERHTESPIEDEETRKKKEEVKLFDKFRV